MIFVCIKVLLLPRVTDRYFSPSRIFSIEIRRYRRANLYSTRRYIRDRVCFVSLKQSLLVRKRSGGEKEIYRGLSLRERPRGSLGGFYSTPIDSRSSQCHGALSRRVRRIAEEESTLTPRVTFITISQMQSVPGN